MRRVLAPVVVATTAMLAVTACGGDSLLPAAPASSASIPATPGTAPPPTVQVTPVFTPGDVAATAQVCADATAAAADVTRVFNDRMAAIEAAAAKGDQSAMVAAAEVIQRKFVSLSSSLTALSRRPVDSDVKAALVSAAAVMREISSESYPGSTQDTQQRLANLATVFATACS